MRMWTIGVQSSVAMKFLQVLTVLAGVTGVILNGGINDALMTADISHLK